MNPLQKKVVERAHYLADKNEGAVNRLIHGGERSAKSLIDQYEIEMITRPDYSLPVEEYMEKVHDISRAKDKIAKDKRDKLIEGLSGPFREEVDVLESREEYPEDVKFKGIKQKPRSKPKRDLEPEQIKKFEGRQKLTRREVVNYISKNIKKRDLIDFIVKKKLHIADVDGYKFKTDEKSLAEMAKEDLIKIINSKGDNKKRNFKKYELLQLAKLSEKGQRLLGAGHSEVIDRLLAKIKANYRPAPEAPSPMLAEQSKAAEKAGFPGNHYDDAPKVGGKKITQSDIDRMQKGLKLYHKFARDYKELPNYGDVMDKKKALKSAYKVYKKLLEKSNGDHEVAMKDVESFHKKILNKHGAGEVYSKTLAKLARKDVDLV